MLTGPLYAKLLACKKKYVVCQGGGDAGKTVSILQYLATVATQKPNQIITVVGQDIPNLKKGALRSFQRYVAADPEIASHILSYHVTTRTYTFINGTIIEFVSFENELDARGSERDYLFINEANAIQYAVFWQLKRKTRTQVIVDYNPTSPFWVHDKITSGKEKEYPAHKVQFYRIDHRHNAFLSEDEHEAYESISDPELFKVYARGKLGKVKGLIFGHFKKCSAESVPQGLYHPVDNQDGYERIIWGIDYGYSNDPTVVMKVTVKGRKRWVTEVLYRPVLVENENAGLAIADYEPTTAQDIKAAMLENGYSTDQAVYSEADPDMVNQLRIIGVGCGPAVKSIIAGISKVREYECYYYDSPNFEKEIRVYKWVTAQDMVTGKEVMTNQPMDAWNHGADSTRYAIYTDFFRMRA